ncbi:MAG: hypothetical protein QY323_03665 [Patescibacteria group bacterium]|nr:MAG: hypothetical protein QY323_03665 [Patescibacteria group bacterium]
MTKKPSGTFYRHILADAWRTVRANKALWLLGFFVSFLGNGGVYELLVQGTGRLGLREDFGGFASLGLLPGWGRFSSSLAGLDAGNVVVILLVALTAIAMTVIAFWVVISSQGGLIVGARDAQRGRKTTFGSLFAAGNETFGSLLALNILSRLAVMAFFYLLLALTVLYLADANIWSVLAYLSGFIFLVPITLIIGFVTIYAACYIALQRLSFVAAIESAIALFRKYWLISVETALILFGVNLLAALGIGAVTGAVGIALIPFLIGASLLKSAAVLSLVAAVAALIGVLFLAFVGSFLAAFQYAVWVSLFTKLHTRGHGGASKLARWFQRLLK